TDTALRIEPQLAPDKWEALLNKGPVTITWKPLKSADGQHTLNYVNGRNRKNTAPLYINDCRANDQGELYTEIGLEPFAVRVVNNTRGNTARLTFSFNRLMVTKDMVGEELTADAPVTLAPELPEIKAYWQDRRTLSLRSALKQEDFWEKISDRPFKLAWKPGFQNIHGGPAPDLKEATLVNYRRESRKTAESAGAAELFLSQFATAGLNQASMDIDGQATFDLTFNKPVKLEEVKKRLNVQKFIYKEKNGKRTVSDFQDVKAEVLRSADAAGTTAQFRLKGLMGEHIRVTVDGLDSADGRGEILGEMGWESYVDPFFTIRETTLEIEEQYPWKPYFSVQLQEEFQFDGIEKFIKLDPPLEFTVSPYGRDGNSLQIFADFTNQPTTVTLLRGMSSRRGVLTGDVSYTVALPSNLGEKLMFTGRGRYLSPEKPLLVKLAGRNVQKVRLQGWRIHENNLAAILNVQDYDSPTRTRLALQFSKNLLDRTTAVKSEAGEVFERLVDLGQVIEEPNGAYLLRVSPVREKKPGEEDEEEDYYSYYDYTHNPEKYLPVMISDLGLSAHVLPGRVAVWANSLSQAKAVSGGTVKLYDSANQVVAEGKTDRQGLFSAEAQVDNVVFLTVEKDGDLNYLLLGSRRSSYAGEDYEGYYQEQDFREDADAKWYGGNAGYLNVEAPASKGPMRAYLSRGYEAFLFMPRDMFKPGETVPVKAMIRDKNLMPSTEKFPVQWRFYDPDGRVVSQGKAEINEFGGLNFAAEIPFAARTGSWSAAVYLPESDAELGRVGFTVEDFVPPRLALELAADQPVYLGENPEMTVKADVRYLFGAPGANLNWEMDAVISPASFRPAGWEGFDFSGPATDFSATAQRRAVRGQLDENGHADILYQPNLDTSRLPTKMAVEFVVSAQEDGGRWNAKRLSVDYFPRNLILGYKAPETTTVKTPFSFQVAAVTPEGKAAELGQAQVRVSQVLTQYYNSYRYGRVYRETAEELKLKSESAVTLANGRASVDFTPEVAGEYEVEISDPASGLTVRRRVNVYGLETAESSLPRGVVELSFDREFYKPGDTAVVKVRSPFPGRLWLTVETSALLYSTSVDMKKPETEVRVPVDKAIKSNAVVTASVVRPLAEGQTGYRALGVKSLEIDRDIYKLNVAVEVPQRLSPSAKTTLKIKMTDAQGRPASGEATVALVDEGVLSLSGFKTPNPWASFTVGRRMLTLFYDLYEQLLPLEKAAVPFLTPGGGDGLGRSGLFSPFKRKQEILSIFLPSVTIDKNGEAVVELNVPEYSGQGRLMVVAGSRDHFGSASQKLTISRDLTSEATLPLALAPGDRFEIPIRVFTAAEAPAKAGRGASIRLRTEGPIRLEEAGADFNLEPGQGDTKIFKAVAEPAEAGGDQAGIGRLIIDSQSGLGESFSQSVEVAVRPPYPRVVTTASVQTKRPETEIIVPTDGYLKGTVEALLTLAKSPAVEASRAVRYLSEYPYGCLEQTTSQAWSFVAAGDLLPGLGDASQNDHIINGLNTAVKRLLTMQTTGGGFAFWPGGQDVYEWGSVYAIHFLTEAAKKTELPQGLLERSLDWLRAYLGADYSPRYNNAA
ncbi:MAG: hypothetical protein LBV79_01370, partial [Candidatus Adiutrix sp.]|nr:hypothetical protein [Candidatus Adiutrix sp.]